MEFFSTEEQQLADWLAGRTEFLGGDLLGGDGDETEYGEFAATEYQQPAEIASAPVELIGGEESAS